MPVLYSCTSTPGGLRFVKWDEDMNPAAEYTCQFQPGPNSAKGEWACSCPASLRPSCKHRKMISRFMLANRHNTQWFHCYETNTWHMPFPTLGEGDATAEKAALAIETYKELPEGADVAEEFSKLLHQDASEAREFGGHLQPPPHSSTVEQQPLTLEVGGSNPSAAATTTTGIRRR